MEIAIGGEAKKLLTSCASSVNQMFGQEFSQQQDFTFKNRFPMSSYSTYFDLLFWDAGGPKNPLDIRHRCGSQNVPGNLETEMA
ncbi:hypothetical protein RvY_11551 [Ramazzottius varieornatus]|uniref:Uncharacterized protein n=1 Tax=Ramazzottius varieornatus TaxID=947166 RepID=A0A1D1VQB6_RAMVA|nr:hypothetical protein RvY_11551 [Ramazzottius varieornatus]